MQNKIILYLAINLTGMKKILVSIIALSILSFSTKVKAQCTPNNSIVTTGIFPAVLDSGVIGVPYSQVIQFHIIKDTTVYVPQLGTSVNATIDSLVITGVKGMPAGFTYQCNNVWCRVSGGTTGCATFKGTPVSGQGGIYPLTVYLSIYAKAMLGPVPVGQTVTDSNSRYFMVIKTPTGVGELGVANQLVVYPNPAKENIQVYLPNNPENFTYQIFNISGSLIQKGETSGFEPVKEISLNTLDKGIYLLQVISNNKYYLKKFVVED